MRNVTQRITQAQWEDIELRNRVISECRAYAGRNPGVVVVLKREVGPRSQTLYKSTSRGKGPCAECGQAFNKHIRGETNQLITEWHCPNGSYWEVWKKFCNYSKRVLQWR